MQRKTMQKLEGVSINCSKSHTLLHQLPAISGKSHHVKLQTQPPQPTEKKTLLSFNSQKKTSTICLSLLTSVKIGFLRYWGKRKGGEGHRLTFLLLAGFTILATRPEKHDTKCPPCLQSLYSPDTAALHLWCCRAMRWAVRCRRACWWV